jgi:hypothetical protein
VGYLLLSLPAVLFAQSGATVEGTVRN